MAIQQTLASIALREGFRFESFFPGRDGDTVVHELKASMLSPEHKQLFIWGASDTGKSHLLQACCSFAFEHDVRGGYFPLKVLKQHGVAIFDGVEHYQVICVDDVHAVLQEEEWERTLFNLVNQCRDLGKILIMSAVDNPRLLPCNLPDLKSRLPWGASYQLQALTEHDRALALQLRAEQRGFSLSEAVIDYIYKRYPRDFTSLIGILDTLDKESLSSQRKITIPFVKEALDSFSQYE